MMIGPDLPESEYERFASPPLKVMLGQVRFPTLLKIADPSNLAPFQERIREAFPGYSEEQQVALTISPGSAPQSAVSTTSRFTSEDEAWSIVLAPDAFTLESAAGGKYASFADFNRLFELGWTALLEEFAPSRVVRLGLRYVDHVEGERTGPEWAEWINPELLGAAAGSLSAGLVKSVSEMQFDRSDGQIVFRHGIAPAGPVNAMGYLLDFDFSTQKPMEAVGAADLLITFNEFHDVLYDFFRWCVTDAALEAFRRG